jgi:hypothetical protein
MLATYQLDRLGVLVLKLPQPKRMTHCYSISIVFLSIDVMKCDILMFRGENNLSHHIIPFLFEGHLRKILWVFLVDSSVVRLGTQSVLIHQFMTTDTICSCHMFQTFPKINKHYSGICATNIVLAAAVCLHGCHDVHKMGNLLSTGNYGLQK